MTAALEGSAKGSVPARRSSQRAICEGGRSEHLAQEHREGSLYAMRGPDTTLTLRGQAAKDHAAEVARIKSAKEEAEAMQVQIRKEMREELERVKTQYLFKVAYGLPGSRTVANMIFVLALAT